MRGDPGFPSKWTGFPGHITAGHKMLIFKKTEHVKNSVVVRISGKTSIIRKQTLILEKTGQLKKTMIVGISGKNVDNPEKR